MLSDRGGFSAFLSSRNMYLTRSCLSLWRGLPDGTRIYFRGRPYKLAATDRRPGLSEKSTFQVATSPANIQKITIKKNQIEWELPTLS